MSMIPTDDVLESLNKLRVLESDQLRAVLELYELEIHHESSKPDYQMFKNHGEEMHRSKDQITKP